MKSYPIILLFLLSLFVFSCNDDLTDLGVGIRPLSDSISIGTDTFHVSTENVFVPYIISSPDSFLLGTFYDEKYGSTHADILAQVQGPVGVNFTYPENSKPDSAVVKLYYRSWFGDNYSPMEVDIYELTGKTFDYSTPYPTNLDPTVYCDKTLKLGHKVFTARNASSTSTTTTTTLAIKLDSAFKNRFFVKYDPKALVRDSTFYSESTFLSFFKGMYITSNFGASTMLNIVQIDLDYYYHYDYTKPGADTVTRVKNMLTFPANSEVRQVNRFLHPDSTTIKQKLALVDSVNYASSPANIQTRVVLPLRRIQERVKANIQGKDQTVNSALLKVEVTDIDTRLIPQPVVQYMLLIKESSVNRFFTKGELPSDTCAILGTYSAALIGNTSLYQRYYSFNVAKLIANELKPGNVINDNYKMMLVPVRVTFDSSNNITEVKQQYLMSSVIFRSGKNNYSPMRINMVYSGF